MDKVREINNSKSKRMFDIALSSLLLAISSPFLLPISLLIKLDSNGPVFVRLKRISGGKSFDVYKFRTMINDAHQMREKLITLNERIDGPFFKIKNDPRVTKIGRILRKFRVDELPQLINVLNGEMSLVGPRAHEFQEIEKYPPEYKHISDAVAGLTGLSQVSGASALPFLKELELDKKYLDNWSLLLDLKILMKTIWIFFSDSTGV